MNSANKSLQSVLNLNLNICNQARSNEIDESTPQKNDNSSSSFFYKNINISPIDQEHSFLDQTVEDVDSAYFSTLKGNSPSINFNRSFSLKLIRSPSLFCLSKSSNFSNESLDSSCHPKLVKNYENSNFVDFLTELFNKSIYHVVKQILGYLELDDYFRIQQVSKLWHEVVRDDLNHNAERRKSIKAQKKDFASKKVTNFLINQKSNFFS